MGKKTRVVLDTNVWVSMFLKKTLGQKFENILMSGKIEIFVSSEILQEISRVLTYVKIKKLLKKARVEPEDVLGEIVRISSIVNPKIKVNVVAEDPDDNKFLECALESEADFIVSGDKHLLRVREFKGIKIVSAREFFELVE